MRLHVVYDDEGTILAASQVPSGDQVLPEAGEHTAEFDVPAEFAGVDLQELAQRLRVDVQENRLSGISAPQVEDDLSAQ
jgi:hypothetical protein